VPKKKAIHGSHPPPCFINIVMKADFPQLPTSTHISPQHYTQHFSGIKRQDLKKLKNFSGEHQGQEFVFVALQNALRCKKCRGGVGVRTNAFTSAVSLGYNSLSWRFPSMI
jgi:hypothetical protein